MIFRRRSMYYIFQMYIPCVCIVALSWVSFWINHEAVPARVALSITTVLTISYMRGSVNAGMPRVSYLKSIDYFLLGGFVFIFMTLLEYVLVLKQSRKVKLQDDEEVKNNYQDTESGGDDPVSFVTITILYFEKHFLCWKIQTDCHNRLYHNMTLVPLWSMCYGCSLLSAQT